MAKIKLFIATSIDGYIAKEDGNLDWLNNFPNPDQLDFGYNQLLDSIDVLIMGRKTYQEILSYGIDWPYSESNTYIVTRNKDLEINSPNTQILEDISKELINNLKLKSQKNIWLVGGGDLVCQFLKLGIIDEMLISIIPIVLGRGIRLFPNSSKETFFKLVNTETFSNGIINLTYQIILN